MLIRKHQALFPSSSLSPFNLIEGVHLTSTRALSILKGQHGLERVSKFSEMEAIHNQDLLMLPKAVEGD
jgi:hypothetical protein